MNELHLFAGAGGGILGGMLLEHTCVCAVEIEPFCRRILIQRQRDGILPRFPIWDDVRTFDGKPWRGKIDIVCGGFPCQGISIAGDGKGLEDPRSGLWSEQSRIIREVGPRYVLVENSPHLVSRGLHIVLRDLATMGYHAKWGVLSCEDVGGVHLRERIWIAATNPSKLHSNASENHGKHSQRKVPKSGNSSCKIDSSNIGKKREQGIFQQKIFRFTRFPWGEDVRRIEDLRNRSDLPQPLIRRIGHDVADGMDRLGAIGNGQVPRVVALAWEMLMVP